MRKALLAFALLLSFNAHASLEDDGVWAAGVWATTVWADGVWREGDPPVSDPGRRLSTLFISSSVPGTAVFVAGTAYTPGGYRYVRTCTPPTVAVRGISHSNDGAMCINPSGTIDADLAGWALNNAGEVIAEVCAATYFVNGIPRGTSGAVCMSDIE